MTKFKCYLNSLKEFYGNLEFLVNSGILLQKRVFLFSANSESGKMAYYLHEKGIDIEGIIDNDESKKGGVQYELPIFTPEQILSDFDDNIRLLIATIYTDSMIKQAESYGYRLSRHIYVVMDVRRACNDFHFVDRSGYEPMTLEDKRESMLGTLRFIDFFCNSNNICYFLGFGSMLGAVRHKGMIPWDDDIDVLLPFPDYKKLTKAKLLDGWNDRYSIYTSLSDEEYYCSEMGVVTDDEYLCDRWDDPQYTYGYPVDIYPIVGLPNQEKEQREYILTLKEKESLLWKYYDSPKIMRKKRADLNRLLGKYNYYDSNYCMILIGHVSSKSPMKKSWFAKTLRLPFENLICNVPEGYDDYLTWMYDDYMTPPPEDKRVEKFHGYSAYKKK